MMKDPNPAMLFIGVAAILAAFVLLIWGLMI